MEDREYVPSKPKVVRKKTNAGQKRVNPRPLMRGMTKTEADWYKASTNSPVIALTLCLIFACFSAFLNQIYYGGSRLFEGLVKISVFVVTVILGLLTW